MIQSHDTRPVADLVAKHLRLAPLDLAIVRRTAIHHLDVGIPGPLDLGLVLVRHEDDGQRTVRK